jgi:fibronectin-binding autotransporter adhesin
MKTHGSGSRNQGTCLGGTLRLRILGIALVAVGAIPASASAQSGTWTQTGTGSVWNWGDIGNWGFGSGPIANGANNTATFTTAGLPSGILINMDAPRTIGTLQFDNAASSIGYTIQGTSTLTLSNSAGPTIEVDNTGGTATAPFAVSISAPLAGAAGFSKVGAGVLRLDGNNTSLSGAINVSAGVLGVTSISGSNPLGTSSVTLSGGTLRLGNGNGYNQKMVVPVGTTFATSGISATMDAGVTLGGNTWYAVGQNTAAPTTGLPSGQTIASLANPTISYTLPVADTTHNNAMLLDATHTAGRFVLATPTSNLSTISFLASAGNGGTPLPVITATLHYSDGTADATGLTFSPPDWFQAAPPSPALGTSGRISSTGYANVPAPVTLGGVPFLFDNIITNPNPTHPVSSIDLSYVLGGGTTNHTAIMAVSVPVAASNGAQNFTNNVSVTQTSAIDIETSAGSAVGNLTINGSTLNVTAGGIATPTLALGGVTMTANPTFNVGAGIVVSTTGPMTDGGTARIVTNSGAGTLTVGAASPSLQPGTGLAVTAGTVNLNSATAFGPSPAVNLTAGTVSLGVGTNPTFGSLTGTGGSVALNGNTLTLGSLSGTFTGSISGGTPAGGSVIKVGAGTQTLFGGGTYTGGTTINGGTLVAISGAIGSGPIKLGGGTLAVAPTQSSIIGFGGSGTGWTKNGSPSFPGGNVLQLTDGLGNDNGSAWFNTKTPIGPFTLNFTVTNLSTGSADGLTVGFQNASTGTATVGNTASGGGGLGYAGITPSAVMEINIYPPNTVGLVGSGIGFLTNGAVPSATLAPATAPVNVGAQNQPTNVTLTFDGTTATATLTQTGAGAPFVFSQPFNFASVGSSGFFGFTGATGGVVSQLQISNFSYVGSNPYNFSNSVAVTASSTLQVTTAVGVSTVVMGPLNMSAGTTLALTPDPANSPGTAYGASFAGTTLNGAATINVTNNGAAVTTLTLGALTDATGTSSLTVTGNPALGVTGGTLGGRLSIGSSNLSLGGASLTVGSLVGTGGTLSGNSTGPITLTTGSDGTSTTYAGNIVDGSTGSLALTKTGVGTLTLTGTNTYSGGTSVLNGTLAVASDGSLGTGPVTITALATLSYSGNSTTSKSYTLGGGTLAVNTGATLTLAGSTVSSGFLSGGGTFATSPASAARFGNDTSLASVSIISNNAGDQFVNFTNGGSLTIAAGVVGTTLTGFTTQGSGSITMGAASHLNASGFESYGTLTLNPAVVGSSLFTIFTNTGSSAMFFNGGSRTFLGTPATAGPPSAPNFVAGLDLHGQNAVIAGGLLVNNGFVVDTTAVPGGPTGSIVVDFGALYKGAGFTGVPVITQNGGRVQAGNSPGSAAYGKFVFGPGGVSNYVFNIDDATGTAGPSPDAAGHVSGWGLISAVKQAVAGAVASSGDFVWTATPGSKLSVSLDTLVNPTTVGTDVPGLMADFDPSKMYSWPAATWAGTYTGPTNVAALDAATSFDTSGFLNPTAGTFGWSLDSADQTLSLVYTPSAVPEPGTLALTAAGLAWVIGRCRKRNPRT